MLSLSILFSSSFSFLIEKDKLIFFHQEIVLPKYFDSTYLGHFQIVVSLIIDGLIVDCRPHTVKVNNSDALTVMLFFNSGDFKAF